MIKQVGGCIGIATTLYIHYIHAPCIEQVLTLDCSTDPSCLNATIGSSTLLSSCLAQDTAPATGGALRLTGGQPCN